MKKIVLKKNHIEWLKQNEYNYLHKKQWALQQTSHTWREGRKTMRKKSWVGVLPKQQSLRKGDSAVGGTSGEVAGAGVAGKRSLAEMASGEWRWDGFRSQLLPPGLCILKSSKELSCGEAQELVFADTRKVVFWVLLRVDKRWGFRVARGRELELRFCPKSKVLKILGLSW